MIRRRCLMTIALLAGLVLLAQPTFAQSFNASINGTILDPTGAAVPNAAVSLRGVATGVMAETKSGPEGLYSFPNLRPGIYELKAAAPGFRDFVQSGIEVAMASHYRVDVTLQLGTAVQAIEVTANASPLNFETASHGGGISPSELRDLPLLVAGNPRSAIAFAILEPGITTGGTASPYDARINGGQQSGDEAMVDGVSMQEGFMSQNGMVSLYQDWPMTPDMVSEVKVLTSNYDPQFGSTTSGVLMAVTKSGSDNFHAGGYWYHRNTALNARQFGALNRVDNGIENPGSARPKDLENDAGGFIGGPARKVPGLWSGRRRTYFYVNFEAFRIVGGVNRPTLTIPSALERTGNFTDWVDSSGNLIPIYDPATTQVNPTYDPAQPLSATNLPFTRQQFMGCNGTQPNVICATDPRLANSLASQWFQFLPTPNKPGAKNNYLLPTPVPDSILAQTNYWLFTGDHYIGDKHHFKAMVWYQGAPPKYVSALPAQLTPDTFSAPQYTFVDRLNWDYTINSTLLNHTSFGYLDRNEGYGCIDAKYVGDLPQIPGVALHAGPPALSFSDGFNAFGCGSGDNRGNVTRRPTAIVNDMLTWVRGKHTLKFGGEYRWIAGYVHSNGNTAGSFYFDKSETGLPGMTSGNSIASFILEQVDSGNSTFRAISSDYPRQHAYSYFVGDNWKLTPKLTVDYGIRWDEYSPSYEKFDRMTFFDPLGANSGAGGRPGRLAYAGSQWGDASFGRRTPENVWHGGFGPRLGIAYAVRPKTVIRAGYGIFYMQAFYPDWGGGIDQTGFSVTPSFSATPYGQTPAFLLSQGLPQNFTLPPIIDSTYQNGKSAPLYRPFDANRLTYAQQWNFTVERELPHNFYVSVAYVANKGTRVPSRLAAVNVLNPSLLTSMGPQLADVFQPGQTTLDGVSIPYAGWVDQMTGCSPTVGQALLPYPQYCGTLQGMNENAGSSTYHSLQIKGERHYTNGLAVLASFTWSKLLTTGTENTQAGATTWSGVQGVISPYERGRAKALASDDVPRVLSVTLLYQLPFGKGKRFVNSRGGLISRAIGGWEMSSIFRTSSGIPFYFRSGQCTGLGDFAMGCLPGMLPGANIYVQSRVGYDPGRLYSNGNQIPLFNVNAFEPASSFNFYGGSGPRITTVRGFNYHDQSLALIKDTKLSEKVNFQIRAEIFNLWNWHIFNSSGEWGGLAFSNDVNSGDFGTWNGAVTNPRNIQVGLRLEF